MSTDHPSESPGAAGRVTLRFESMRELIARLAPWLGPEGTFVASDSPLAEGSRVEFELKVRDQLKLLHGEAEVAWVRRLPGRGGEPVGMALRFLEVDPAGRRFVERLVESHRREGGEPFDIESGRPADSRLAELTEVVPTRDRPEEATAEEPPEVPDAAAAAPVGGAEPSDEPPSAAAPAEPAGGEAEPPAGEAPVFKAQPGARQEAFPSSFLDEVEAEIRSSPPPAAAPPVEDETEPVPPDAELASGEEELTLEVELPDAEPEARPLDAAAPAAPETAVPGEAQPESQVLDLQEEEEIHEEPFPAGEQPFPVEDEPLPTGELPPESGEIERPETIEQPVAARPEVEAPPEAPEPAEPEAPEPAEPEAPEPAEPEAPEPAEPVPPRPRRGDLLSLPDLPPVAPVIDRAPPRREPSPPLRDEIYEPPSEVPPVPAPEITPGAQYAGPRGARRTWAVLLFSLLTVGVLAALFLLGDRLLQIWRQGAVEAVVTPAAEEPAEPLKRRPPVTRPPAGAPEAPRAAPEPATAPLEGEGVAAQVGPQAAAEAEPPAGPPPAEEERAAADPPTRIESIEWEERGGRTVVTVLADRPIRARQVEAFRLDGGNPRQVVKIAGIRQPLSRPVRAVGTPQITRIRSGLHELPEGTELHLVFDLSGPAVQLERQAPAQGRLQLVFAGGATP